MILQESKQQKSIETKRIKPTLMKANKYKITRRNFLKITGTTVFGVMASQSIIANSLLKKEIVKSDNADQMFGARCEYLTNPMGIDDMTPGLSWTFTNHKRGVRQVSYHLLVASSPDLLSKDQGDFWDSDEVKSDASHLVSYAGKPLQSRQSYFWKVSIKTIAAYGSMDTSPWSEINSGEMGLL